MKAIILAAGRGSRMGSLTDDLPKCRTVLHNRQLIEWQLNALSDAGIDEIAIVRGYLAETFDFDLTYFDNIRWSETNMVMSLLSACDWLHNDVCVTSYSDIIYSTTVVCELIKAAGDIVITYDPNWEELWNMRFVDPLSDAETFRLDGDRIVEIGNRAKTMDEIEGQFMGLVKYTPAGWRKVNKYLEGLGQDELDILDMTGLLQGLIRTGIDVSGVAISDHWYEVDSESDLNCYKKLHPNLFM